VWLPHTLLFGSRFVCFGFKSSWFFLSSTAGNSSQLECRCFLDFLLVCQCCELLYINNQWRRRFTRTLHFLPSFSAILDCAFNLSFYLFFHQSTVVCQQSVHRNLYKGLVGLRLTNQSRLWLVSNGNELKLSARQKESEWNLMRFRCLQFWILISECLWNFWLKEHSDIRFLVCTPSLVSHSYQKPKLQTQKLQKISLTFFLSGKA